jgi:hypothetical protein
LEKQGLDAVLPVFRQIKIRRICAADKSHKKSPQQVRAFFFADMA